MHKRGGVTLTIPKRVEAEILEPYLHGGGAHHAKPRFACTLITARHSPFYLQGLPQGACKKLMELVLVWSREDTCFLWKILKPRQHMCSN